MKSCRWSQRLYGACSVAILSGRLASGRYAAQPAATAAGASAAFMSSMTRCESASGGSRTLLFTADATRQPVGAVKVAPPVVASGVSADSSASAADAGDARIAAAAMPMGRARHITLTKCMTILACCRALRQQSRHRLHVAATREDACGERAFVEAQVVLEHALH